jgi:hypothetical protein
LGAYGMMLSELKDVLMSVLYAENEDKLGWK